jgi:glycosidase
MNTVEVNSQRHQTLSSNQVFIFIERTLSKLEIDISHEQQGIKHRNLSEFKEVLSKNIEQIAYDFLALYAKRQDAFSVFYDTIMVAFSHWQARSETLIQRDTDKLAIDDFYNSHKMVGASCYIDLFAGNIMGMVAKIDYLKSLGISYLYILPPFKVPVGNSDGGFAISDYKSIRDDLGTMDEMQFFINACHQNGISVVLDFVLNHTADDHEWAQKAQLGVSEFEDFYLFFEDENEVNDIIQHVEATFPDKGPNIIFNSKVNRWVWTTFNINQWDLNYHNPSVLKGMLDNVLYLANVGVDVLRLDAVSLVWKEKGTNCKSLPQIQILVRLFKNLTKLVTPALEFKSEAIVKPQEVINYVSPDSATLSYRPLLSSTLWHALASGNIDLLATSLERWHQLPEGCTWINYIRSHDDIPWVFCDLDIQFTGSDALATRKFLDQFYSDEHEESFAKGLPFMRDSETKLARISGTTASLAGLEKGINSNNATDIHLSLQRILLLHSLALSVGGLPLLYLGDEVAVLNDYTFINDRAKCQDSRWVNRTKKDWSKDSENIRNIGTPASIIFNGLKCMIETRKKEPAFSGSKLNTINLGLSSILAYQRGSGENAVLVLANFSAFKVSVNHKILNLNDLYGPHANLLNAQSSDLNIDLSKGVQLEPYEFLWLKPLKNFGIKKQNKM